MVKKAEKELEEYIIENLQALGWRYLPSLKLKELGKSTRKEVLLKRELKEKIIELNRERLFNPQDRPYLEDNVERAINILENETSGTKGIQRILEYIKFGVPTILERSRNEVRLDLIDYYERERNSFIVTNQVEYEGKEIIRTDIILYVNGIPLADIEVKSPEKMDVSWESAFDQIKRYERSVPDLYKFVQIGVAVETENKARYFPIAPWIKKEETPIYKWKEKGKTELEGIFYMLEPKRLLDIIRYFLLFRAWEGEETKVLTRYMQYRAANKIVERVKNRILGKNTVDRGLIWHWQGSGKTLTMIFAAMKLYYELSRLGKDPLILFVVDRRDLQRQLYEEHLTKLDLGPALQPYVKVISSIEVLKQLLEYKNYYGPSGLYVTLVHKFRPEELRKLEEELELRSKNQKTVMNREDVILLIDEAHRSQYGVLAEQMMNIFKEGNFYAFTGTPVPRKNPRKNTFAKFSPKGELYLDKYFILESIEDRYTVPIAYRPIPLEYQLNEEYKEALEAFMESDLDELGEESDREVAQLPREIRNKLIVLKRKFLEKSDRIEGIAKHIAEHFREHVDGRFKAMVVAASRKACIRYKRALDKYLPSEYSEVVITFMKNDDEEIEKYRENLQIKYETKDVNEIIRKIIDAFKHKELPKILIVTDMLLTGFDVPVLQTMYLDKPLKGYRLLQAIARVNRPYEKGDKEFGMVIDYIPVFKELKKAFRDYEEEDLKGAAIDFKELLKIFRKALEEAMKVIGAPLGEEGNIAKKFEIVRKICESTELTETFLSNARKARRLYPIIREDLSRKDQVNFEWVNSIYKMYLKEVRGDETKSKLDEVLEKYISVKIKELELPRIEINRKFFEEFLRKEEDVGQKATQLVLGLNRFMIRAMDEPEIRSLSEEIRRLVEDWRKRVKDNMSLYEEAVKLWRKYFELKEERERLGLDKKTYSVYLYLTMENEILRWPRESALKFVREVLNSEQVLKILRVKDWPQNRELERRIRRMILDSLIRFNKKEGLGIPTKVRIFSRIVEDIVERLKGYEGRYIS